MEPVIGELHELLSRGISLAGDVRRTRSWDAPAAGSPAATEIAAEESHPDRPMGSWPWLSGPMVARWALHVATTEVEGFAAVLDVGTPYAADVLCRAILESTSLVWWLLEPDIGAQRRLARALAYRLRSAIEAERAVEHLGLADDEDRSGYGERRAEVIGAIEELGLEYRAVRGGRPITVGGETLPGYSARVSALVRAVWPQAGLPYALLSQVGHGELVGLALGVARDRHGRAGPGPLALGPVLDLARQLPGPRLARTRRAQGCLLPRPGRGDRFAVRMDDGVPGRTRRAAADRRERRSGRYRRQSGRADPRYSTPQAPVAPQDRAAYVGPMPSVTVDIPAELGELHDGPTQRGDALGTLLDEVGPAARGETPTPDRERLGEWLAMLRQVAGLRDGPD